MSKFDSMWHFAERHPLAAVIIASTVVNGVVNFTRAVVKPFVKQPETACNINLGDVAKTVADSLKKSEQPEEPNEESECDGCDRVKEAEEVEEINPEPPVDLFVDGSNYSFRSSDY